MAMDVQASWVTTKPVVRATGGMVAAQHKRAADVGAEILRGGGNAVDAAIATSLALAVLEPWMSGLGGGGFLVVAKADGRTEVLDFGMVAPAALDPAAYPLGGGRDNDLFGWPGVVDDRNVMGPLSIAVPGQAAGLGLAFERHASLPWRDLCAPAIALADAGAADRLVRLPADHRRRARSGALRGGRRALSAGRPAAGAGQRRRPAPSADPRPRPDPAPAGRRRPAGSDLGRARPPAGRGRAGCGRRAVARGSCRPRRAAVRPPGARLWRCPDPDAGRADRGSDPEPRFGADRGQDRRRRAARRRLSRLGRRPVRGLRAPPREPRPYRRDRPARRKHQPSLRRRRQGHHGQPDPDPVVGVRQQDPLAAHRHPAQQRHHVVRSAARRPATRWRRASGRCPTCARWSPPATACRGWPSAPRAGAGSCRRCCRSSRC